ncbi:hypothetical protein HPB49_024006 [Dermacentor silvarum]|uniref:Uncharacterized protein n=1 Tax=Dermacentor silvarum TaxID=543639 RepID=A0ACB8E479_DERSI|nr:hypothetical protein HPB49_024006 [Dermacentor silvarum]
MRAVTRPELTRPEQVAAEYWDGLGVEECLPDLCFASGSNEISSQCTNISRRRVVSVVHFIKVIQDFNNHRCAIHMAVALSYGQSVGFWSEYTFKCNGCGENKKLWRVALLNEMTEAGKQEKMLAEAAGDFCEDGSTPSITVVVDGAWSHRSHGHRYSANSGLAVIIGKRTQKLLYLGVRNKLCSTC